MEETNNFIMFRWRQQQPLTHSFSQCLLCLLCSFFRECNRYLWLVSAYYDILASVYLHKGNIRVWLEDNSKEYSQFTYNVTSRRVCVNNVALEKQ